MRANSYPVIHSLSFKWGEILVDIVICKQESCPGNPTMAGFTLELLFGLIYVPLEMRCVANTWQSSE